MNLDELETARFNASVAASNQGRTLGIAGLGFVWLFASDFFLSKTKAHPSSLLAAAGAALAVGLLLDLAQLYVRWATLERAFNTAEARERAGPDRREAKFVDVGPAPAKFTVPLFKAKFLCIAAGYVLLAVYLAAKLAS